MQIGGFSPKKSISHTLIILCVVISVIGFILPQFKYTFAFHSGALSMGIMDFLMQGVLFQFLHGDFLHLLMNCYFLYVAGPAVEARMSKNQFVTFFITTTIFIIIGLTFFATPNSITIGISGFCTALLAYISIDLWDLRHPQAGYFIILLLINIAIGFANEISFVGHFFGAVWGVIWWFWLAKFGRLFHK